MNIDKPDFFESGFMKEPKLSLNELELLKDELSVLNMRDEVEVDGVKVTLAGGGVTTKFDINLETAVATLDEDSSYDVFSGENNWDDSNPKPIHDATTIHASRLEKLNQALDAIADPKLIE